ncbi:Phosphatidylcholine:ceramide cholinephosphotransferase 2 [Orchesella cincta]|uniref:Phosphatidylcholine:ceramide cholinephosphotransferase 2 n=1 Tax=Orchesella cincta TaxID=48709 RepID=A0A1D2NES8_ORCCI|nr:Phosphatidylcholine:ceramide cholinephosphotransferase 2 [Orchesella cincta]
MPANHLSEPPLFERDLRDDLDDQDLSYASHDSLIDLGIRGGMSLDRNANQIERISKKDDDDPLYDYHPPGTCIQIHPEEIYIHSATAGSSKQSKVFPKERKKTVVAFALMAVGFICNSISIFLTHQKIPDRNLHPPLPDIALDNITKKRWLNDLSDIIVIICTLTSAVLIISHKHRWILARRVFVLLSLLYSMRSVTMYATVLPLANDHVYCSPKLNSTSFGETMWAATREVLGLMAAGGLGFMGKKTLCGDYIFSGHTIIFMMTYLLIREYTPKELVTLHWVSYLTSWIGIVGLLISHGHYTIDVIIGYYATTRLFWIYHALACRAENKRRSCTNHLSEVWWFPLFRYFEGNANGKVPHEYSIPRLRKKSRMSSYAYKALHMIAQIPQNIKIHKSTSNKFKMSDTDENEVSQTSVESRTFSFTSPRLTLLAVHKIVDTMQLSVKRMDSYIAKEIRKLGSVSHGPMAGTPVKPFKDDSLSSGVQADIESFQTSLPGTPQPGKSERASSAYCATCPIDTNSVRQAAKDMLDARKYIFESLQEELHPFVMKHAIARAVNDRNVQLVRLAITSDVSSLDFRALDGWLNSANVPEHISLTRPESSNLEVHLSEATISDSGSLSKPSTAISEKSYINFPPVSLNVDIFLPPNEFDWFSRDKMGKLLSMSEASELFSIIRMSDCAEQLRELYINAKRPTYNACSREGLMVVNETLSDLSRLTTLVLRGMCDDNMLRVIGQRCERLAHLDVSFSKFVTDTGIQQLFFKESNQNQNSALYLISAWIVKNMDKMNPLIYTISFLDYSWSSVTSAGRKMIQLLPGSYLFKRLFAKGEQDAFGHHIFIREQASLQDLIPSKIETPQCKTFEKHLYQFVGSKGVKTFLKIIEYHPWRNCMLNLYALTCPDSLEDTGGAGVNSTNGNNTDRHCYGIITPNQIEKRIQGIVHWCNGSLTQLYTIYPVNINTLGILVQLKLFRGIINDTWRLQSSLLPELTQLEIFTEPSTLINIIECCPNLQKLRVRIRTHKLLDSHIVKPIQHSMCRRTLQDLWIAPGSYPESHIVPKQTTQNSNADNVSNTSSLSSFAEMDTTTTTYHSNDDKPEAMISELVQLSLECITAVLTACPNLKRLGDISLWSNVEPEELYVFCEQLKKQNYNTMIIWANLTLPNYSQNE